MTEVTNVTGGAVYGHERHRSLRIKKTENGYEVVAKFLVEQVGFDDRKRKGMEDLTYVFYTTEEALDFAKNYLDAAAGDLEK